MRRVVNMTALVVADAAASVGTKRQG
jgi:hypothetical protein